MERRRDGYDGGNVAVDSFGTMGLGSHVQHKARNQDELEYGSGSARCGPTAHRAASVGGGPLTKLFGSRRNKKGDDRKDMSRGEGKRLEEQAAPVWQPIPRVDALRDTIVDDDQERTKTQQVFEDKKAHREQRRSLRESGDFLGVQGANPRTGYWDVSEATTSSDPSQVSDETKRKLDQQARKLGEQKRAYEEAQKEASD